MISMTAAMSCATEAESLRVTDSQCLSMKASPITVCKMTMGTMMMIIARANRPVGICLDSQRVTRRQSRCGQSGRGSVGNAGAGFGGSGGNEAIPDSANRLQMQRIGRIAFDLATQAIDLHIYGSFIGNVFMRGEVFARHSLPRLARQ